MKTFRQEGDQVVLEIHANVLRLGVKYVLLLLAEHLDIVLGLTLLLLLNYLLEVLFLLCLGHFLESKGSLRLFISSSASLLLILVVGHVVVRLLILQRHR